MSDITWIILLIVFWRLVVGPVIQGFRSSGTKVRKKQPSDGGYVDYEEL